MIAFSAVLIVLVFEVQFVDEVLRHYTGGLSRRRAELGVPPCSVGVGLEPIAPLHLGHFGKFDRNAATRPRISWRKAAREAKAAIAYLRTSSATNVGTDKDSEKRQRDAIQSFAVRAGIQIVDWFYDAAGFGADPIDTRPGFRSALERVASNGVRTIVVETANRFARDLIVQETGYRLLREQGIELIAADSPGSFVDDTPTAALIRQVLGAVSQFEKAGLVAKLRGLGSGSAVNMGNARGASRTPRRGRTSSSWRSGSRGRVPDRRAVELPGHRSPA